MSTPIEHSGPPSPAVGSGLPAAPGASMPADPAAVATAGPAAGSVSMVGGIEVPTQGERDLVEGRLLTPAEVGTLFGVDPRTVSRWSDRGLLEAVYTPGGHRRYRYLDVMALRDSLTRRH